MSCLPHAIIYFMILTGINDIILVKCECKNEIINKLFKYNNILYLTNNAQMEMTEHPKIIVATSRKMLIIQKHSSWNYFNNIIQADDESDFVLRMDYFRNSTLWEPKLTPRRYFVIFINKLRNITLVLNYAKRHFITQIIVINYLTNATFNWYKPTNYCTALQYKTELSSCDDLNNLNYDATSKLLHGCRINVVTGGMLLHYNYAGFANEKYGILVRPLAFLTKTFEWNVTFIEPSPDEQRKYARNLHKDLNGYDLFIAALYRDEETITDFELSDIVLFDTYIWLMRKPKRKSNVKILISVYEISAWIGIACTLIIVTAINWSIDQIEYNRNDILRSFLDAFRLTIGSSVKKLTQLTHFRVYVILYIVYSFHINYVYQGKLSALLTSINYEERIQNVEQLAASNLVRAIPATTRILLLNSRYLFARQVAQKSRDHFNNLTLSDAELVLTNDNLALLTRRYKSAAKDIQKLDFIADTLTKKLEMSYVFPNGSFYIPFVNIAIQIAREHGFLIKWIKDVNVHYKQPKLNVHVVLTFEHLQGAFILLITGLVIALFMFLCEICSFNFKKSLLVRKLKEVF